MRTLGDRRDQPDVKAFAGFCRLFLRAYENYDYDIGRNGEAWLLERLRPLRPKVVFDVGANVGDWSVHAAVAMPEATIHAFKPFRHLQRPGAQRDLASRADIRERFRFVGPGRVDHAHRHDGRQHAQQHRKAARRRGAPVDCPVRAGDAYMAERGIEQIDLLKIDVEGAEHLVLAGFTGALAAGRIDVIQFEYGQANILTRFLLRNFYLLLEIPRLRRRQAVSEPRRLPGLQV